jgi:hypothetical protein
MRTLSHLLLLTTLLCICIYSCKKQFADNSISQSLKDKISSHCFSTENIQQIADGFIVENDILLTENFLDENPPVQNLLIGNTEQFQTNYLVTGLPRTISIQLSPQFSSAYSLALDEAIRRFNNENLLLHFERKNSAGEINIIKGSGNYLAVSGFPSANGQPCNMIRLNSMFIGNNNGQAFINYVATIITHEIGHCIGFRHTDYLNRSFSCGGKAIKESCGSAGAVLIPGTNSSPDNGSWMLTCIISGENRLFTDNDKIALHYLY